MQPKKLTPLEILQKQKIILQAKSDELSATIENNAKYLQQNFVPLLRNSLVESAVSKLPAPIQNLVGVFPKKDDNTGIKDSPKRKIALVVAAATEVAPFFLKGKKGAFISLLLKQVVKWVI